MQQGNHLPHLIQPCPTCFGSALAPAFSQFSRPFRISTMAAEGETETTPGLVDMKVTAKKSINFYMNSAKAFFTGVVDKEGKTREPVCVLNISGLGDAINIAAQAAGAVVKEGLATIHKIETSYPEMKLSNGSERGCARIMITLHKKV
eukprot:s3262_g12.t1